MSELENQDGQLEGKQPSAIEQQALAQGWVPKDKFDGDEDSFIDAKEFVRRGELFSKIDKQNREVKALQNALKAFKEHYSKVEEASYEKALKELKTAERQALEDGDVSKFYAIKDEITEAEKQADLVKDAKAALDNVVVTPTVAPEFLNWVNKNPWYENYKYMREFADDVGQKLFAQGVEKHAILKQVEQAVKNEFPNKFVNPNKEKPGMTESGKSSGGSAKTGDFELNDQERTIMNTLVKSGILTKEKYIADLKKAKGIK